MWFRKKHPRSFDKRWMIRKALLQAIKHKRHEIFMLLLTVIDVDFCDKENDNPLSHIFEYCTEIHEIRQFLRPLLEKIGLKPPSYPLRDFVKHLSRTGDTELISELFDNLLPKYKYKLHDLEWLLDDAIENGMDEVAKCMIEHMDKFFPGYNNPDNLHAAVIQRSCPSFNVLSSIVTIHTLLSNMVNTRQRC